MPRLDSAQSFVLRKRRANETTPDDSNISHKKTANKSLAKKAAPVKKAKCEKSDVNCFVEMSHDPPPEPRTFPPPKAMETRNGGAKAKKGNGMKKCEEAAQILGVDSHGCNIYKDDVRPLYLTRLKWVDSFVRKFKQCGKVSAEFGELPQNLGGSGPPGLEPGGLVKKLAFQAAHVGEIMQKLPHSGRPIKSVDSLRKYFSDMGFDLSEHDKNKTWFFLQFSAPLWNKLGHRCVVNASAKEPDTKPMSPSINDVKRAVDGQETAALSLATSPLSLATWPTQVTLQKGQRKRTGSGAVLSSKKPKTGIVKIEAREDTLADQVQISYSVLRPVTDDSEIVQLQKDYEMGDITGADDGGDDVGDLEGQLPEYKEEDENDVEEEVEEEEVDDTNVNNFCLEYFED